MAKTVTLTLEDDEIDLLLELGAVTDFYSDGYDDMKKPGDRAASDIYGGFLGKLKAATTP